MIILLSDSRMQITAALLVIVSSSRYCQAHIVLDIGFVLKLLFFPVFKNKLIEIPDILTCFFLKLMTVVSNAVDFIMTPHYRKQCGFCFMQF